MLRVLSLGAGVQSTTLIMLRGVPFLHDTLTPFRTLIAPAAKRYEDPVSKRTFTRWRIVNQQDRKLAAAGGAE